MFNLTRSSRIIALVAACLLSPVAGNAANAGAEGAQSGNPIPSGWYADPEAHVFDGRYGIFPTYSAPYNQQTFMDAFSSRDLITWTCITVVRLARRTGIIA